MEIVCDSKDLQSKDPLCEKLKPYMEDCQMKSIKELFGFTKKEEYLPLDTMKDRFVYEVDSRYAGRTVAYFIKKTKEGTDNVFVVFWPDEMGSSSGYVLGNHCDQPIKKKDKIVPLRELMKAKEDLRLGELKALMKIVYFNMKKGEIKI